MFWVMDLVGLLFLAGALACILLPLTLGGGSAAKWKTAEVITPLIVGVLCLPAFAMWEWKMARHPIFPFHLMRDKHVMSILLISFLKNIASSTRDSYMYFTLVVSFNQGVEGATRINSLENFASSLTVVFVAFIVRRFRIVKPLVVVGVTLIVIAQGMLIHFRGGYSRAQLAGLIAGELLDGIGTGMSSHPSLVAMQAKLSHEHALLVTSCWAVGSQAGGGVAAAISGAVWTNMLPGKLRDGLINAGVPNATTIAQEVYKSPLKFVKSNPPGSVPREAIVNAYRDVQKVLCTIAVCIAAVLIPLSLLMDNVHLDEKRNLVDADESTDDIPAVTRDRDRDGERDRSDSDIVDEKGRSVRSAQ
jgi:SIT family siderophore-iron:H+ symporter-like MFS transporter